MKILVVCQHYWPEPFNVTDACETLVKRGHDVTVLTGMPNTGLPGNEIPEEYQGSTGMRENHGGVQIVRVSLHPRRAGAVNRIRNYLSFWRNANRAVRKLDEDYDVVLGYQFSPIMQVDAGLKYAKLHGKKMLLYSFDLWPASLLAGGFKEGSLPFRWMKSVSRRIYSQADRIAVTSPLFDMYFRGTLGLDIPDSAYLPQYAEDAFLDTAEPVSEEVDASKINLTFAGNVGQAQSVMTIIEAAALLKDNSDIVFHIVGSGSQLSACMERAKSLGLANVVFHGRHPLEEMPSYYAASDAMIVTFEASPMAEYTLPRKVQTYLAAGKPVLAAAEGETRRVIDDASCGLCCGFEDPEGFARIACEFAKRHDKECMGERARTYYDKHFSKNSFFEQLEKLLFGLTKGEDR